MTDFGRMKNYADYIKPDPFRRALHFPTVEEVLGDLNNKRILDIGCGDGLFPNCWRNAAHRSSTTTKLSRKSRKRRRTSRATVGCHFCCRHAYTFFARRCVRYGNVGHGATVCDIARGAGSLLPLRVAPPQVWETIYLCHSQSFVLCFWTRLHRPPVLQAGRR